MINPASHPALAGKAVTATKAAVKLAPKKMAVKAAQKQPAPKADDLVDRNGDGAITKDDCPYPFGSEQAKVWWSKLEAHVSKEITPGMKQQYGDAVKGAYKGKPLVPDQIGPGQGDFDFLVDKLQVTQNISAEAALKVALKVKNMKYGPGNGT